MNNILKIHQLVKKTNVELNLLTGIHEPLDYEVSVYFNKHKTLTLEKLAVELGSFYKQNQNDHFEKIALVKSKNYEEELIKRRLFSYYIFYSLLKDLNLYNLKKKNKLNILKKKVPIEEIIKELKEIVTSKGLLILSAGSTNVTSDWDVTIICSKNIINKLLKTKVNKNSFSYYYAKTINVEPTFYGILNNTHSLIYDNNLYIELLLLPKNNNFYQYNNFPPIIKKLLDKQYISFFKYKKNYYIEELDMIHKKLQKKGVICKPSLKKQLVSYQNIMKNINSNDCFKYFLKSRNYKSEAYQSLSALLVTVVKTQLGVNIKLTNENYLVNSIENFIDFYLHSNTKYIKYIDNILLIKLSKYLLRFFDSILKYNKSISLKYYLNPIQILVNIRGKNNNIDIKNLTVNDDYKEIIKHALISLDNIDLTNKIDYNTFLNFIISFLKKQFNSKLLIKNPNNFSDYLFNILNSKLILKNKCYKIIQLSKDELSK